MSGQSKYAERVVQVGIDEVRSWPGNPRRGDAEAIRESIATHGLYKPIIVQRGTGYILAGNNVWAVAREMGIEEIGVVYLNVDEDDARKIVLMDNRSSDAGGYDDDLLRQMLLSLNGDFDGSGYEPADLDELTAAAAADADGQDQWVGSLLGGGAGEEVLVLEEIQTGADWAELPQQTAARAERQASQMPSVVKGTREIMLIYTIAEHEEMIRLLDGLKSRTGADVRYPQIVQRLVREAAQRAGLL